MRQTTASLFLSILLASPLLPSGVSAREFWMPDTPDDTPSGNPGGDPSVNLPDFPNLPDPCADGPGPFSQSSSGDGGDGGSSWLPGVNCTGGNWTINLPDNVTWPGPLNSTENATWPWGDHEGPRGDPGAGLEWLWHLLGNLTQELGLNGTFDPANATWPWGEGSNGTWPLPCMHRRGPHGGPGHDGDGGPHDGWNCTEGGDDFFGNLTCNNGTVSLPCVKGFPFLPCENGTITLPCPNGSNSSDPFPWGPPHRGPHGGFPWGNWTEGEGPLGNLTCENGTISIPCPVGDPFFPFPCENGTASLPCDNGTLPLPWEPGHHGPFGNWSVDNSTFGNWSSEFNLTGLLNCTNGTFPVKDFLENVGELLLGNLTLPNNFTFGNWTFGNWSLGNFSLGNLTLPCPVLNLPGGGPGLGGGTGDGSGGQGASGLDSNRQGNADANAGANSTAQQGSPPPNRAVSAWSVSWIAAALVVLSHCVML